MKIEGRTKTQVEIGPWTMHQVALEWIKRTYNVPFKDIGENVADLYINKDERYIFKVVEYAGSHRWTEEEVVIKNPTEEQLNAIRSYQNVVKDISKYYDDQIRGKILADII